MKALPPFEGNGHPPIGSGRAVRRCDAPLPLTGPASRGTAGDETPKPAKRARRKRGQPDFKEGRERRGGGNPRHSPCEQARPAKFYHSFAVAVDKRKDIIKWIRRFAPDRRHSSVG